MWDRETERGFLGGAGGEKTRSEMIEGHSVLSYHCKVDMIALLNDSCGCRMMHVFIRNCFAFNQLTLFHIRFLLYLAPRRASSKREGSRQANCCFSESQGIVEVKCRHHS